MYLKSKAKEPRAWIHVIPCIECYVLYNDIEWGFFFGGGRGRLEILLAIFIYE